MRKEFFLFLFISLQTFAVDLDAFFREVKLGNLNRVIEMVNSGADIGARDKFMATPLHYCAYLGHSNISTFLIENGAPLEARDHLGRTPLHMAVSNGHYETIKLLIDYGA